MERRKHIDCGERITVYHGTNESYESFDKIHLGKNFKRTQNAGNDIAFYFTSNVECAKTYGRNIHERSIEKGDFSYVDTEKIVEDWINEEWEDPADSIRRLKLRKSDPEHIDAWDIFMEAGFREPLKRAIKEGTLGVIFDFGSLNSGYYGKVVGIFDPGADILPNLTRPSEMGGKTR